MGREMSGPAAAQQPAHHHHMRHNTLTLALVDSTWAVTVLRKRWLIGLWSACPRVHVSAPCTPACLQPAGHCQQRPSPPLEACFQGARPQAQVRYTLLARGVGAGSAAVPASLPPMPACAACALLQVLRGLPAGPCDAGRVCHHRSGGHSVSAGGAAAVMAAVRARALHSRPGG